MTMHIPAAGDEPYYAPPRGRDSRGLPSSRMALERLREVTKGLRGLAAYRDNLARLDRADGLDQLRTERAYAAERDIRVLLSAGLDGLNGLADSGVLSGAVADVAARCAQGQELSYDGCAAAMRAFAIRAAPDLDPVFLDELDSVLRGARVQAQGRAGTLEGRVILPDGQERPFTLHATPRPGDMARVSTRDFFTESNRMLVIPSVSLLVDDDCHHQSQSVGLHPSTRHLDLYGESVRAMALAREVAYRHARTVNELGRAHVRGHGPAVVAVLIGVLVASVIAGTIYWATACREENPSADETFCKVLSVYLTVALLILVMFGTAKLEKDDASAGAPSDDIRVRIEA